MPRTKIDIPNLPASITAERDGEVGFLRLSRPEKRNALNDTLVMGIEAYFAGLPEDIRAVVLSGDGDHFSAGLDLSELTVRGTVELVHHSRNWHRVFDMFEFGKVPVIAVLHGAVVGGGLELASACHVRVAEKSAYYALPEGSRGIYVGGGGSVRIPRLIGTSQMMDMMLTGRIFGAEDGQQMGISNYLVENGDGLKKGIELASASPRTHRSRICDHERAAAYRGIRHRGRLCRGIDDFFGRVIGSGSEGSPARIPGKARTESRSLSTRKRDRK